MENNENITNEKGKNSIFTSNGLKIIACICMLIDHTGVIIGNFLPFRYIGRLAFPIFAFLIAVGAEKTKHEMQYLIRIFVFAVLSEPVYDLLCGVSIDFSRNMNILFTMFIALIIIFAFKQYNLVFGELALICSIPIAFFADISYGIPGILLMVGYYFANKIENKTVKYITLTAVTTIFAIFSKLTGARTYQFICILSSVPIILFNGKKGKIYKEKWKNTMVKYAFYAFYPVHMCILYLVYLLIN